MAKDNIVLVIGATGGVGSETALAFSQRDFRVRALHRGRRRRPANSRISITIGSVPLAGTVTGRGFDRREMTATALAGAACRGNKGRRGSRDIQSAAETVRHYWRPPRFELKA